MPGKQVDGMDIEAVAEVTQKAVEHARSGKGPYLIESLTYRYYGHSRSDPAPYRTKEEEKEWKNKDAISTYQNKLIQSGMITQQNIDDYNRKIETILKDAVTFADNSDFPDKQEIFDDIYA